MTQLADSSEKRKKQIRNDNKLEDMFFACEEVQGQFQNALLKQVPLSTRKLTQDIDELHLKLMKRYPSQAAIQAMAAFPFRMKCNFIQSAPNTLKKPNLY